MKIEIDLENVLGHLGGFHASNVDFLTSTLRDRCGEYGKRLAAEVEEQTAEALRPAWTDGDVVDYSLRGGGKPWTLVRVAGEWIRADLEDKVSGWTDESTSRLVEGRFGYDATVIRQAAAR